MSDLVDERSVAAAAKNGGGKPLVITPDSIRARSLPRLFRRAGVPIVAASCAIVLVMGFINFAERIANAAPPANPRADAIVVLTGGSSRIGGALNLLADGHASRLLISGVNPSVTSDDLARLIGGGLSDNLDCCVDLDRQAIDTAGNAVETREWVEEHDFSSLIVVTSNYHMPRSMIELAGAMPEVKLIAFPVSNPALRFADWWRDPPTFSLLAGEFSKYVVARARRLLPISDQIAARPVIAD